MGKLLECENLNKAFFKHQIIFCSNSQHASEHPESLKCFIRGSKKLWMQSRCTNRNIFLLKIFGEF